MSFVSTDKIFCFLSLSFVIHKMDTVGIRYYKCRVLGLELTGLNTVLPFSPTLPLELKDRFLPLLS